MNPSTVDERNRLIDRLTILKKSLYDKSVNAGSIPEEIEKDFLSSESKEAYLKKLIESLNSLDTVQITIAFDPGPNTIILIKNWLKQNLKKTPLIDLKINPNIIGGVIIVYNGKYADFSVKKKMDNYFKL